MAGSRTTSAIRRFKQNASCVCCVSRRDVLSGFAAVATGAALPCVPAAAQAPVKPVTNAGRIDVHRHFVPPGYLIDPKRPYLNDRSTIPRQLEDMDRSGVSLSVMSLSAFGDRAPGLPRMRDGSRAWRTSIRPSSAPTIAAASASSPGYPSRISKAR